jgi:glycosyltransferase involved in cell wall biosynthesis
MRQYLLEQLDAVYPISENGKRYIEANYPCDNQKIKVNRLGTGAGSPRIVHKLNDRFSIISCSWISEVKRVDRMISVLSKLPDRNVEWTHFGGGDLLGETERLAHEFLDNKVEWRLTGTLSHDEIMATYSQNDFHLFLNLSSSEGIPVSIMEACSYGIPVIATDVGGTSEIVTDGYNGFLVDKDFTDEDVIMAIERLQQMTDDEYCRFCENSLLRWKKRFSAKKNYADFYLNLPYRPLDAGKRIK